MKKILSFILLLSPFMATSQTTFSWRNDQNPTSGQWNVTNYWWNGSGAALPGGAEILFLDGSVGTTMTNDLSAANRYRITFGSTNSPASRTINGSTTNVFYDYSNSIPAIYNASGVLQTINFPFQIGNTSTSTSPAYGLELNASSGNLTFGTSATISAQNSTGTKVLVLRASGGGSGTVTLNGVISNGSGTMSISKIETNTAILGALNSYTGSTAITGGTLRANISQSGSTGPLGNGSTVTISSGATLDLNNFNATVASVSETGTSNGGVITLGSGTLTISGGWSGTRYQNSISGTNGSITKQGTGILSLYGTQSYTGTTTVSGGELSTAVAMSSTSYNINGGTFRVSASNILSTSCNATVSSGTFSVDNSQTINNLDISGGTLSVAAGQTLTINGTLTISGSPTINLNSTGKIVYGSSGKLVINSAMSTNDNIWPVTVSEQPKDVTIGANVSLHTAKTVANLLTINSGATFDLGTNILNGTSLTTSGTGTLATQNSSSTPIPSGRTWSMTVNYNRDGSQSVVSGTYGNLTCTNTTSATKTMLGNITVSGTLSLSTSKLAIGSNTLTLNGNVSGMSASNSLTGSSTSNLSVGSTTSLGTIYFDQTTSADVTTTNGTNALQNLILSGSGGSVTIGNKLNLFNRLSVSAGTLNTGDALVLRSTSSNTAYVDQVAGTISGQVTVERYFHKQFRGWRMATAPVTYNGIISNDNDKVYKNWQSDFGFGANYGTRITANATPSGTNGLDDKTNSANLLTYNSSSASWNSVVNTKTETMSGSSGSADNKGFFVFVRGDRTVLPTTNGTPNSFVTTTLAAKGLLQTGTQTFNYTGVSGNSWLIGNPYACPVDMSSVTYNNIGNFVYFWDPNLTGATTNSPGTYTYFDRNNWAAGPVSGTSTKYFQSGQGILVKPTNATASITFNELNKSTSSNNNTQTTGTINASTDLFNIKLFAVQSNGDVTNVDGLRAKFGNYNDNVDEDDCIKIPSSIESIGLSRGNNTLAIEARPFITTMDTLFLVMNNMVAGSNYEFLINPVNFDASVSSCKLIDNFLNIETPISLTTNTSIPFSITNVAGSNANNRFSVVFTGAGALPNNKLVVTASKQNNNIVIDWKTSAETAVKNYIVQKSTTSNDFTDINTTNALNGNVNRSYSFIDRNPSIVNYYRIKTINNDGSVKYSSIVKVDINNKSNSSINVYPNPVTGNTVSLQLNNIALGIATVKLFNSLGQMVYTTTITNSGTSSSTFFELNNNIANGNYQLQIIDAKGNSYNETILKMK